MQAPPDEATLVGPSTDKVAATFREAGEAFNPQMGIHTARTIGRHTYIASASSDSDGMRSVDMESPENLTILWGHASLRIGAFCSIGAGCTIYLGGDHRPSRMTTYPFGCVRQDVFHGPDERPATRGDVVIGNDVWIGERVTIMSGVRIGDGAVVGTNSHVVSNVRPYCVVGGNPAQSYYFRHPPEIVRQLRAMRWWTLPDDTIREIVPLLLSTNPAPLLAWWARHATTQP